MHRVDRLLLLLPACALACAGSPAPAPAQEAPAAESKAAAAGTTIKRSVVIRTRKSGVEVTTMRPDGTVDVAFEVLENGRGPKVEAKLRIAADGTLASLEAHGHNTMGAPVDETFAIEGKHARWKSREEEGEKELDQPAFYAPNAPLPVGTGLLFAALQHAGGTLALLPAGEARLERESDVTVHDESGHEKHLFAWSIIGLDLTPTRLWAEEDGTYFGIADDWFSSVPEGWEGAIPQLIEKHKALNAQRDREFASKLAHKPPAAGLAFVHARVLDVEKKKWLPDHTVVISGDKIVAVGPTKKTKPPKGAEIVDASGKALLPGLWDMHTHVSPPDGALNIASGITTVRDLANDPDLLDDFKRRYDEGSAIGPHVFRSGFIEGRGEKAAASKITAETEEEAKEAVEFYAKRGYEGIKIYNSMKEELVPLLAKLAHEHGMRVSGHIPVHMRAEDAVRAGYDEIQHINMVFLNFFIDRETDTRTPLRFSIVAEKGASLDLASQPVKDFIKLLLERKTVLDPTVNVFEMLFTARQGQVLPAWTQVVPRLPAQVQRWFTSGGLPVPEGKDAQYKQSFARVLEMLRLLHDSNVPMVAGTDGFAGFTYDRELELYVQAGLSPGDVLEIATIGAARVMKRDRTTGSIAKGKDADLVLIDGDPLAHIEDVRRVITTVRSGVSYSSKDVFESVGVRSP